MHTICGCIPLVACQPCNADAQGATLGQPSDQDKPATTGMMRPRNLILLLADPANHLSVSPLMSTSHIAGRRSVLF